MSRINIKKRGKVYQYCFEAAKVNGKRKQITKSGFKTKNAAYVAGEKAYEEYINGGCVTQAYMSYGDYLDYWLEHYCKEFLAHRTVEEYSVIANKYLKPGLGHFRLNAITGHQLNMYLIEICKRYNYSYGYFRNFVKTIKCSFRVATDIFGFIRYNPSLTIQLPPLNNVKKKLIKHVYTQEEIDLILNRFKNNSTFTCLFITACYTGMRPSEICALTWNDIDFEKRLIKVRHNVYSKIKDNKGRWFLGSTKTVNGIRDIYISDTLYIALKNFKNRQDKLKKEFGKNYHYYHLEEVKNRYGKINEYRIVEITRKNKLLKTFDLVFTKDNGIYNGTDITRYPYKVVHGELGINNCRFYDLRGSFATRTLRSGVEIRDVADILGHSKIETTENYYISSSKETMKNASKMFEQTVKSETIDEIIKYLPIVYKQ